MICAEKLAGKLPV